MDWRIWVGAKWPLDPVVWGAPVVLTYLLAPYGLWAMLAFLRQLRVISGGPLPLDAFSLLALIFWVYAAAISLVLGATAVTHERERQTWEQLCLTALSGGERTAGFLAGRLGPVWASLAVTSGLWWLLYPDYAALLAPWCPPELTRGQLAFGAGAGLWTSVVAGMLGLLSSARARQTTVAVVAATLRLSFLFLALAIMGPIALFASLFLERQVSYLASLGTIAAMLFFICRCPGAWARLVADLERP